MILTGDYNLPNAGVTENNKTSCPDHINHGSYEIIKMSSFFKPPVVYTLCKFLSSLYRILQFFLCNVCVFASSETILSIDKYHPPLTTEFYSSVTTTNNPPADTKLNFVKADFYPINKLLSLADWKCLDIC